MTLKSEDQKFYIGQKVLIGENNHLLILSVSGIPIILPYENKVLI